MMTVAARTRTVVAVDLGTYCDNSLMVAAIERETGDARTRSVVYVTDRRNAVVDDEWLVKHPGVSVVGYSTPAFLTTEGGATLADPSASIVALAVRHPLRLVAASSFIKRLAAIVEARAIRALEAQQPQCCSSVHLMLSYPASILLHRMRRGVVDRLVRDGNDISVLHYAPSFPNTVVPWLFDSRVAAPSFRLYRSSPESNRASWTAHLERIALSSGRSLEQVLEVMRLARHVRCWLPEAIPVSIDPDPALMGDGAGRLPAVVDAPPLLAHGGNVSSPLPDGIAARLAPGRRNVLVTFGSFGSEQRLRDAARELFGRVSPSVCGRVKFVVLGGGADLGDAVAAGCRHDVIQHDGHVPYPALLRRCCLVVFTGSLCLQNACIREGVRMLLVPLLTEQYFWAKNHLHRASAPFLDSASPQRLRDTLDGAAAYAAESIIACALLRSSGRCSGSRRGSR